MGYMHIENLYKNQTILMFKECYALEKIHGTSAHLHLGKPAVMASGLDERTLTLFSGGCKMQVFEALFDVPELKKKLCDMVDGGASCTIYGEAYGGKIHKMSHLYGPDVKFVAFEVKIGDVFLNVPKASQFVHELGLEFVDWQVVRTDMDSLDGLRDASSEQGYRNDVFVGVSFKDRVREGIVLRPLEEMVTNNGKRVIAKHKGDKFKETKTPRKVDDPEKLKVLANAKAIIDEWVTEMRLQHVLDSANVERDITNAGVLIKAMQEDIRREGAGEIVVSRAAMKAIGNATVALLKKMPNDLGED